MINYKNYYLISSNIFLTKGYKRSLIVNFIKNTVEYIPNDMYNIVMKYHGKKKIEDILMLHDNYKIQVKEYFNFLINKNYIQLFASKTLIQNFLKKYNLFDIPYRISNVVIEINNWKNTYIIRKLLLLNIEHYTIVIKDSFFLKSNLSKILSLFYDSNVKSIELHINTKDKILSRELRTAFNKQLRLYNIYLYNQDVDEEILINKHHCCLLTKTKTQLDVRFCGIVHPKYFSLSMSHYTESLHYNTCLNRKIAVDAEGNIKNCPSMPFSYGNIKDINIEDVIKKKSFQKYWNIKKDDIAVCKDCEFRYICTDCRAYLENPKDLYSKPLKCGYNPYTNKWEEWSKNPLKQKAIKYYDMQEILPKE